MPGETKQAWVYRSVCDLIARGSVRRGDPLPSTRALAARWGVSRGIVEIAFAQLSLEGYVASQVGRGTEVIADLAARARTSADKKRAPAAPTMLAASRNDTSHPSTSGRSDAHPANPLPANARLVDTRLFTLRVWHRHLNRAVKEATPAMLAEDDAKGHAPLRLAISRYLGMTRGILCDPSQIIVTTGIRHAIDLISKALCHGEMPVYIEDPGYKTMAPLLRYTTRNLVFVPLDAEGFRVDAVDRACRPGIAFVTPAHQAPLGITMSVSRRSQLLAWATRRDMWIVEDDYDSEFSYGHAPLPALKAIDRDDRVIHCGSFNKSLFPSLRIGYMVLPAALTDRVARVRSVTGRANSLIEQVALTHYIDAGDFARHLRASRAVYMQRRDALLSALRTTSAGTLAVTGEQAGFHVVLWLPQHVDERVTVDTVLARGVHVEGLATFSHEHAMPPAIVVGYASLDHDGIANAARVIGDAVLSATHRANRA
ncbi:PLP-dependent aminotransferase family protein [Robbsia sp. KACC 23696]|uniref:MocR-like pyridoxine biosynthesis transcription factor PdxR n=1 Tax=Robbsia sp. KACC 23696 TaxID=3149231 RepID=UPI00325BBBED